MDKRCEPTVDGTTKERSDRANFPEPRQHLGKLWSDEQGRCV